MSEIPELQKRRQQLYEKLSLAEAKLKKLMTETAAILAEGSDPKAEKTLLAAHQDVQLLQQALVMLDAQIEQVKGEEARDNEIARLKRIEELRAEALTIIGQLDKALAKLGPLFEQHEAICDGLRALRADAYQGVRALNMVVEQARKDFDKLFLHPRDVRAELIANKQAQLALLRKKAEALSRLGLGGSEGEDGRGDRVLDNFDTAIRQTEQDLARLQGEQS